MYLTLSNIRENMQYREVTAVSYTNWEWIAFTLPHKQKPKSQFPRHGMSGVDKHLDLLELNKLVYLTLKMYLKL